MNKKITIMILLCLCLGSITGCGKDTSKISQENKVENTIQQQLDKEDNKTDLSQTETDQTDSASEKISDTAGKKTNSEEADSMPGTGSASPGAGASDVDYDLTQMNSDLVYATVYQLMVDPSTYEGKTIRMSGSYYAEWYEQTQKNYFCVIIQDALGCCAQGMEFIWDDGSHIYPDEYPQENATVEVTGTFETYQEEGDAKLYCRLKDATMIVK